MKRRYVIFACEQEASAAIVVRVLAGIPDKDIGPAVNGQSQEDLDLLVKYVYRGMSLGENCGTYTYCLYSNFVYLRGVAFKTCPVCVSFA